MPSSKVILFWSKHAFAATAVVAGGYGVGLWPAVTNEKVVSAASLMAQIGATMMGFVMAMIAIMATFGAFRFGRNLQRTGRFSILLRLMTLTAISFLLVTIVGSGVSVWDGSIHPAWITCLFWLILWSGFLLLDAMHKLFRVIELLQTP